MKVIKNRTVFLNDTFQCIQDCFLRTHCRKALYVTEERLEDKNVYGYD